MPRGKAGEQLDHTGRLTGEIADRPPEVPEGQELDRKILREDEELALVIRGRFNQCGHLVGELIKARDGADEVLERGDAKPVGKRGPCRSFCHDPGDDTGRAGSL